MIYARPMVEADLDKVMDIQFRAYLPEFREKRQVFEEKLHRFPSGCWIAEIDGQPVAYLFSHPWMIDVPPLLDSLIGDIPEKPDCYFIHDLAVDPRFKGKGIGSELFSKAGESASECNLDKMALVSVQNSRGFWSKFGFRRMLPTELTPRISHRIASYGSDACFMTMSWQIALPLR